MIGCILCSITAASYLATQFAPRRNPVDQTPVAGIPGFKPAATELEAFKPETFNPEPVALEAAAFEAVKPQAVAFEDSEFGATATEEVKPQAVAFDEVAFKDAEFGATATKEVKPQAVAFDEVAFKDAEFGDTATEEMKPQAVALAAVAPVAVAFEDAEFRAGEFGAAEPEAVTPEVAAPEVAESSSPLSIEFSTEAFAMPESKDALSITVENNVQFLAIPDSDFFEPITHIAPPVPVQIPVLPGVATLAVPSSQSSKRTTDPPFMNGRSQRVPPPPEQVANEPTATRKIGTMHPVSRTTLASGKHTNQSDREEFTGAKQTGIPTHRLQAVSPSQAFRRIRSALSH